MGFRPDRALLVVAAVAGLLAAGGAVLVSAATDRVVLVAVALALLALAGAGLRIGDRLAADHAGIVVRGPTSARRIPWSEIVRVSAPSRRRMGVASTTLEIELRDDELLLFGRIDLGTDPELVADALRACRPG